jgi:hypothetical protein
MPASQTAPGPTDAATHEPGLSALALGTLALLRQLVADVLGLVALETRLAGLSLGGIVLSALAAAFAVMAFWLMLQAGLIVAISRTGIDVLWLLAGFTLLNGLTAVVLLLFIRRLSRNLTFRATAEALRGGERE